MLGGCSAVEREAEAAMLPETESETTVVAGDGEEVRPRSSAEQEEARSMRPKRERPEMIRVAGGEFLLDFVQIEPRPVWVDEFEIAVYKVTIGEWREFLRQVPEVLAWNPPQWSSWDEAHVSRLGDDQYTTENLPEDWPVMSIRWYDALWYANWLSERHGYEPVYEFDAEEIREYLFRLAEDFDRHKFDPGPQVVWRKEADGYRLPTEAEWQYAAIGGQANDPLWEREDIDEYAWLGDPSNPDSTLATPRPVGLKKPNALGLYDVVGLAMEWNWNYFNETYYDEMPYRNPTGPDEPFWTDFEQQLDGNNMRVAPGCNFWMRRRYCVQRWHGIGGAWGGPTVGLRLARGPVLDPDGERQ